MLCTRQDILGQYSMVNLELYSIVDEIKKVSKAFVVHPKNVNAENATSMTSNAVLFLLRVWLCWVVFVELNGICCMILTWQTLFWILWYSTASYVILETTARDGNG